MGAERYVTSRLPNTGYQIPNTKYQIPNTDLQIPTSKYQMPTYQIPNQYRGILKSLKVCAELASVLLLNDSRILMFFTEVDAKSFSNHR